MTPQGLWERFCGTWAGPLIGYELRASHPARWFRIHSLPGSKRYPDTAAEEALLVARHRALLDWAFAGQSRIVLSSVEWDRTSPRADLGPRDLVHSERDDGVHRRTFLSIRAWDPAAYDALLLDVAHERLRSVTFCDLDFTTLIAPYDGGVDLFFSDPARLAEARAAFAAWRSPHPGGL